jgi:predicted house-cleaning noncanonical NTP pyrophosphatase (MazG superfamily)
MSERLVRDRIPELFPDRVPHDAIRVADPREFLDLLASKLLEESAEFAGSREIEELADVLEVVRESAAAIGATFEDVERIRIRKAAARGGFGGRVVWSGPDGSEG